MTEEDKASGRIVEEEEDSIVDSEARSSYSTEVINGAVGW